MTNMLLYIHIAFGGLTFLITLLEVMRITHTKLLFAGSYFGTALSGVGMIIVSESSLSITCVRFLAAMLVLTGAHYFALKRTASDNSN